MSKQRKLTKQQEKLRILLKDVILNHHPKLAEAIIRRDERLIIDDEYFSISIKADDGSPLEGLHQRPVGYNKL